MTLRILIAQMGSMKKTVNASTVMKKDASLATVVPTTATSVTMDITFPLEAVTNAKLTTVMFATDGATALNALRVTLGTTTLRMLS